MAASVVGFLVRMLQQAWSGLALVAGVFADVSIGGAEFGIGLYLDLSSTGGCH